MYFITLGCILAFNIPIYNTSQIVREVQQSGILVPIWLGSPVSADDESLSPLLLAEVPIKTQRSQAVRHNCKQKSSDF